MSYDSKHFRDVYPAWAWKKCSFCVRHFYRPLSFPTAAVLANMGISANAVSYASAIVAIFGSGLFLINNYVAHILGAILINVWLLMDCVDGNLARGVRKQPFGGFADAMSSYLLVGLMCTTMGVAAYFEGGVLLSAGTPWIIVMGALASNSDSLMRLIYQKYKSVEREMADEGLISVENDVIKDPEQGTNIIVRIEFEFGVGGILPLFILLGAIFQALDLVVLYCFFYYGGSCFVSILMYVRKAIKRERQLV